ncbi:putative galactosylxylosylprotein 3-beta-galactosyltransferase [Helianthus annuus]|uniref:Hexosyltransferase n=1 Tax=Helianthus annuus TaxID=4232 RepID=A0A251T2T3_HELAN|nr:probable beta-1,3-galactosyltransferase 14 [Helianthus annuus]KAF5778292.1 putative galactosylxylosylprotein 3-beta-galactosyltransferase [Helianthus annuus]KAJ0493664.1 putative galactosylxylosylprotein 3-beta-galactosyltransferase [Helianthus annuus]KAJ0678596.1 putative galactosylxylosylprotein 3-beta-galactosyltransferase [Helianthus annuus]KAJ0863047.1 putative galactosylxylosylprotein 3-beta-galactosyltransferase [Helianthus annuus]
MPMPKKFFQARSQSNSPNRSILQALCILIGITGVLLFIIAVSRGRIGAESKCKYGKPLSVSVVWDKSGGSSGGSDRLGFVSGGDQKRRKVMGFVGIQTGFASVGRRKALRKTWMPSDHQGLQRLEEATGLAFRFIIGKTSDASKMAELRKEVEEYDDFLMLDIVEEYSKLPYKTLAFFKAAYALYDSEFYVKADDDIYLRPDRLSLLLAKERTHSQTYLGCMKKGPVFTDPKLKWYEPLGHMLGKEYFLHAYGPIYALSADVVSSLVALRNDSFRMFSNEDVTIGAWMLAMNVNHEDNRQLCQPECTATSIAVWDIPKCSGLCNPEKKMLELHKLESCASSPTLPSDEDE